MVLQCVGSVSRNNRYGCDCIENRSCFFSRPTEMRRRAEYATIVSVVLAAQQFSNSPFGPTFRQHSDHR